MIPVHQLLALAGFEPITLTVERSTPNPAAINEYGDPVRPDVTLLQIEFVYHQTSRKTVVRLELDEGRDWRSFYCRERLQVGDQTPDVIRADGERWQVTEVGDYGRIGGIYLVRAARIE